LSHLVEQLQQRVGVSAFLAIPVEPGCDALGPDGVLVLRGESHNHNTLRQLAPPQLPRDGESIHTWHVDVQQGKLRRPGRKNGGYRLSAQNELTG
jgi:hypothetical protein